MITIIHLVNIRHDTVTKFFLLRENLKLYGWHTVPYWCHVYNRVGIYIPRNEIGTLTSSNRLFPRVVIAVLLTVFPVLHSTSPRLIYFVTAGL